MGEARAGAQQPIELAARLEFLEPSQRRDHLLAHLVAVALALNDLQVERPCEVLRRKYMRDSMWCAHDRAASHTVQTESASKWHYISDPNSASPSTKSNAYARPQCQSVEDGLEAVEAIWTKRAKDKDRTIVPAKLPARK